MTLNVTCSIDHLFHKKKKNLRLKTKNMALEHLGPMLVWRSAKMCQISIVCR